jgi:phosphinothricin acetyltransferase
MKTIRLAKPSDAHAVAEIYRPLVEATPITFENVPPSEQEMGHRIASALSFAPWLVHVEGGDVTGYVYASRHHERAAYGWSVNVSVFVRGDRRRSGVGLAMYKALFALLRLQGFYAAHAGITLPNAGSVGLHESFGFRRVALYPAVGFKLGAWHDVGWWQLPLRERTGTPAPPLDMSALLNHEEFPSALAAGTD